ncbi:MAG TPA: hypothetical protein VND64_03060 [Pirellulales bacterium]|nr:hypothetical protein [Pirellulales bacterium]
MRRFSILLLTGVMIGSNGMMGRVLAWPPPPPGSPGPRGPRGHHLRQAYDTLSEVALLMRDERELNTYAGLFNEAKEFYRSAHQARLSGDDFRSGELAVAANDAARGLRHWLGATLPPATDLPLPPDDEPGPPPGRGPRGPEAVGAEDDPAFHSRELLSRARERIVEAQNESAADGAGRQFLDASRRVYEEARTAYIAEDYPKAAELGRAVEAWTHVGEHLLRAEEGTATAVRERRAPPPRDARVDGPRRRGPTGLDEPPPPLDRVAPPRPPRD